MPLPSRLTKNQSDLLNGDGGRPSPVGKEAENIRLGDRLDVLARLSRTETDPLKDPPGTLVGADIIQIADPDGILPPHDNLGDLLRTWATGIDGTLPPPAGVAGAVVVEANNAGARTVRRLRDSDIDPVLTITAFVGVGPIIEAGAPLDNPTFTASYSVAPAALTVLELQDDQGGPLVSVIGSPSSFSYLGSYGPALATPGATVTWTLLAEEGVFGAAGVATVTSATRTFHGPAAIPGSFDEAFVEALASQPLLTGLDLTYTEVAGLGEYNWHVAPVRLGVPTFSVDGLEAIWIDEAVVSITNDFGVTEDYQVRRSTNPNLGTAEWTVSST